MDIAACILIPLAGTMAGAAMVFLMGNKLDSRIEKLLDRKSVV